MTTIPPRRTSTSTRARKGDPDLVPPGSETFPVDPGPVGEAAPAFEAASSAVDPVTPDRFIGKVPFVLAFCGDPRSERAERAVSALNDAFPSFGKRRAQLLVVLRADDSAVSGLRERSRITVPVVADPDGKIERSYLGKQSEDAPTSVLVDMSGTVVGMVSGSALDEHVTILLDRMSELSASGS